MKFIISCLDVSIFLGNGINSLLITFSIHLRSTYLGWAPRPRRARTLPLSLRNRYLSAARPCMRMESSTRSCMWTNQELVSWDMINVHENWRGVFILPEDRWQQVYTLVRIGFRFFCLCAEQWSKMDRGSMLGTVGQKFIFWFPALLLAVLPFSFAP